MDVIAAISTATGNGGVGIIRMSGKECFEILNKIFKPKNEGEARGYSIKYGHIIDEKNEIIDEVLVSYFYSPKSYTTENMCEINSHGGISVTGCDEEGKNCKTCWDPYTATYTGSASGTYGSKSTEVPYYIVQDKVEEQLGLGESSSLNDANISIQADEASSIANNPNPPLSNSLGIFSYSSTFILHSSYIQNKTFSLKSTGLNADGSMNYDGGVANGGSRYYITNPYPGNSYSWTINSNGNVASSSLFDISI